MLTGAQVQTLIRAHWPERLGMLYVVRPNSTDYILAWRYSERFRTPARWAIVRRQFVVDSEATEEREAFAGWRTESLIVGRSPEELWTSYVLLFGGQTL